MPPAVNGPPAMEVARPGPAEEEDDAAALADQLNGLQIPRGSQVKVLMQGVQQAHGRISQLQDENRTLRARLAALEQTNVVTTSVAPATTKSNSKPDTKGITNNRRAASDEAKEWKAMYVDALKKLRDAQQELSMQQGKSEQLQEQVRSLQDSDAASVQSATPSAISRSPSELSSFHRPPSGSTPTATPSAQRNHSAFRSSTSEILPDDQLKTRMEDHTAEARKKLPPVRTSRVVRKTQTTRSSTAPKWMQSLLSCVSNSESTQPKH